jgi:hypothetical protein
MYIRKHDESPSGMKDYPSDSTFFGVHGQPRKKGTAIWHCQTTCGDAVLTSKVVLHVHKYHLK